MSRDRFDLHVHSTASDGNLPPREVIALAAERGLAGVALTDHDTCDGIAEAVGMAAALDIQCIAGVELSCTCSVTDGYVHILGYFVDPANEALNELFAEMREQRVERASAIVDLVNEITGVMTLDDVLSESNGAPPGRPHIARAMVRHGLISEIDEAFHETWFGPGGRAFVSREGIAVARAIEVIHGAGGVAVYAHPGARSGGIDEAAIRAAAAAGLDGIEVDHPVHDDDVLQRCVELATELGLVQTAGSDDHAAGREGSRMGCRTVPRRIIDALEARRTTSSV